MPCRNSTPLGQYSQVRCSFRERTSHSRRSFDFTLLGLLLVRLVPTPIAVRNASGIILLVQQVRGPVVRPCQGSFFCHVNTSHQHGFTYCCKRPAQRRPI